MGHRETDIKPLSLSLSLHHLGPPSFPPLLFQSVTLLPATLSLHSHTLSFPCTRRTGLVSVCGPCEPSRWDPNAALVDREPVCARVCVRPLCFAAPPGAVRTPCTHLRVLLDCPTAAGEDLSYPTHRTKNTGGEFGGKDWKSGRRRGQ